MIRQVVILILLLTIPIADPRAPSPDTNSESSGISASILDQSSHSIRIVGYFPQWGIYNNDYTVQDLHTSGAASILTHINYAFANISPDLRCYAETRRGWGDAYADYGWSFDAAESVNGVGDTADLNLKGHFNQLRKLKQIYPHLKVLISIGGSNWSGRFSDAALPEHREAFVRSCIDMFIRGNLPRMEKYAVGGPRSAARLFDGIDIDWEFPASPGFRGDAALGIPPNIMRPEDTQNFTALLAEFRRQLNALGAETRRHYLLTIAAPAIEDQYRRIQLAVIHSYLDFINVMAYNLTGAWNVTGPTGFHAPLYSSSDAPSSQGQVSVDTTVSAYLAHGIPSKKLVIGVPFFGRGWTGVPNQNNGLYQSAPTMSPAPARFEAGREDYRRLRQLGFPSFRNPQMHGFWVFDGSTFWSYDDPKVITAKVRYIQTRGLGGMMIWALDGDDGTLMNAIANALN